MPIAPSLKLYWVFENDLVRREYYKDSKGGLHVKTIWKRLPPVEEELI